MTLANELLARANVVATGVGYKVVGGERSDTPSIICSVEKKLPASALSSADLVPRELDGIATEGLAQRLFAIDRKGTLIDA